jgi:hypothetical protein
MQITIDSPAGVLAFIKRNDVSADDCISVFGRTFNVLCVTLIDAVTEKANLDKADVVKKIEEFILAGEFASGSNKSVMLF